MNNPYDPIEDARKHTFYNHGYERGLRGNSYTYPGNPNTDKRTSWGLGYLHGINRRKMTQLILGDKYNEYTYDTEVKSRDSR